MAPSLVSDPDPLERVAASEGRKVLVQEGLGMRLHFHIATYRPGGTY